MKFFAGLLCLFAASASAAPIVIAHRGASGYLPEHTLEAYAMAHALGADYIEPDLVMTKDGVLICLHDIHLESTTDVEQRFPARAREDGQWYAADFTLEEIRTLRAHERMPKRFPQDRGGFRVPTYAEMIELVQGLNATTGREAGIYPELKDPPFHKRAGLPMLETFLKVTGEYGYTGPGAKIFVQCFVPSALRELRAMGCDLPMVVLMGDAGAKADLSRETGIASFAQGVGPSKDLLLKDPSFVERAHAAGLQVHPYTFRADAVGTQFSSYAEELRTYVDEYRIDGYFTDFPGRDITYAR